MIINIDFDFCFQFMLNKEQNLDKLEERILGTRDLDSETSRPRNVNMTGEPKPLTESKKPDQGDKKIRKS